jgi:glycosyltransferase involved in cell wall biosynthesis
MKISVCMATYNGEQFLRGQMDSILCQIKVTDELIIVDDCSTDNTREILTGYSKRNQNVKILYNPRNIGPLRSFERAIGYSSGDTIFLADQDDIWLENKAEIMLREMKRDQKCLAVSDARIIDMNGDDVYPSFFSYRSSGSGLLKNFYKNTYLGCCMLFESSLKSAILPMPRHVAQHDEWIGLVCELVGGSTFLPVPLLLYRRHEKNTSSFERFPLWKVIVNRLKMAAALLLRGYKIYQARHLWRKL